MDKKIKFADGVACANPACGVLEEKCHMCGRTMAKGIVYEEEPKAGYVEYVPTQADLGKIASDFAFHPPSNGQVAKYTEINSEFKDLALLLTKLCPPGRHLSLALTNLKTAAMYANSAIAVAESDK